MHYQRVRLFKELLPSSIWLAHLDKLGHHKRKQHDKGLGEEKGKIEQQQVTNSWIQTFVSLMTVDEHVHREHDAQALA
ncbi:hypothetical protein TNCV_4554941 [Trichonephila clavipes]|nr:hypothetical protein TNCV_4554941 [Trichonephila clavipes]